MRKIVLAIVIAASLFTVSRLIAQAARVSPHETLSLRLEGNNLITLTYGRPYSKDPKTSEIRKIWGTLVPWGKPWRMGSDEATLLLVQKPIMVGTTAVPAGAYTLYMMPMENGTSQMALSKTIGGWGIPVDDKHDFARVDLKKDAMDKQIDQYTMAIDKNPAGGATIKLMWEKTQYSVDIANQK